MNITEFAKIAGVSKSAVSRYFNNGYLAEDKRLLIESAIEETGYAPSLQAQTVRTRITKLVGVILPKLSSESCARVVEGISDVLDKEGYQILLVNTNNHEEKEVEYLELFRQNRVDGVILLATILTKDHERVLRKMEIPVIIVGQEYRGYNCVCHDDYAAAYTVTELMIKKQAKNIAYIGVTEEDKAAGLERKKGFMNAMLHNQMTCEDNNVRTVKFNMDDGYHAIKNICNKGECPDAIFCATDSIAIGAMKWLRENKIRVPEDVMVSAIGDSKAGRVSVPTLTSCHFHYKTSGTLAAEFFCDLLKKKNVPKVMKLDYSIIERESTGIDDDVKLCETHNFM